MLGITDIANRLGLDRSTVFRWAQLGKLTPVQKMTGATGALLFDADEVEAFVTTLDEPLRARWAMSPTEAAAS